MVRVIRTLAGGVAFLLVTLFIGLPIATASAPAQAAVTSYDTVAYDYDALAHSVQARTGEAAPVALRNASKGGQETVAKAIGPLRVVLPEFFATNSGLPTLEISAARMPNIAANIRSAQAGGQPVILTRTTDGALIASNRAAACKGFCGLGSPDEYPFASTLQGGAGATVRGVPIAEQRIQGGVLARFYHQSGVGDGDQFIVRVVGGAS